MTSETFDVIVIGAGWFGLVAAKTYIQISPRINLAILEASSSLGGTWSEELVYSGLRTHNALGGLEVSDLSMEHRGTTEEGYVLGEDVTYYLHRFVEKFDLHRRIRYHCAVEAIKKADDGEGWELQLRDSSTPRMFCRKLIIATGLTSRPFTPDIPIWGEDAIPAFHGIELRKKEEWLRSDQVERVVVYGGSKSAFDAVYLAASAGKHVDWVIRTTGQGVGSMFTAKSLGQTSANLSPMRLVAAMNPCIYNRQSWLSRFLHGTVLGNHIVRFWWKSITNIAHKKHGLYSSENGRKLLPELGELGHFWSGSTTTGVISQTDFFDYIHKGDRVTVHRAEIISITNHQVHLSNDTTFTADALIWATGWIRNDTRFDIPLALELGLPVPISAVPIEIHKEWAKLDAIAESVILNSFPMLQSPPPYRIIPRTKTQSRLYRLTAPLNSNRSIAFVGTMHTSGTAIISEIQALWAVAYLEDKLHLPPIEEMRTEVAEANAWFRKRYLNLGEKCPNITFEYVAYVDLLLRDLGLECRRKGGVLSEWVGTYRPRDYGGVVEEWCQKVGMGV
ncbi:FAD/NAD(P)-binding domain-containing protein [Wilcoxina mikolae CBS 423.85]|nr:FAD/NAD(P)-binding domain-containing protein [Wilcoxina mikolae CBS 423.85]